MSSNHDNPWGLTPVEAKTMDAMVEHGCAKLVSEAIHRSTNTIRDHTKIAAQKMNARRTMLKKYIMWDRFRQQQQREAAQREAQRLLDEEAVAGCTQLIT